PSIEGDDKGAKNHPPAVIEPAQHFPSRMPEKLASCRYCAYIRAILIGFAGRTKQKEWAKNPLFSFAETPLPKRREASPA
ncbi:MAG: hypothetical protein AAB325_17350, partial [Pseudomonadota bacterium]